MTDTAAIEGTLKGMKTLADKTFRLTVDVDERQRDALFAMFDQDAPIAIARLQDSEKQPEYGQWAKRLRLSGFFRVPEVWKALGTDAEYQKWCRQLKCAVCGGQDWDPAFGEGRCEFAHVRRAGESGTSYKAEYAGIPLCHQHHQIQHQQGEAAALKEIASEVDSAKEWFDRERISHVEQWAWERLKHSLGFNSMKHVPPELIKQWADERELTKYLPHEFKVL